MTHLDRPNKGRIFNILDHLDRLTSDGGNHGKNEQSFHCPVCNASNFKVMISGPNEGKYSAYGCDCMATNSGKQRVIDAISPRWEKPNRPKSSKIYTYETLENLTPVPTVQVRRSDDGKGKRNITQWHQQDGLWVPGLPSEMRSKIHLYRIFDEINQTAIADGEPIFIVEGEGNVNDLIELGIAATCSIGGASGWNSYGHANYVSDLSGAVPVICPDRDVPGLKYGDRIADDFPGALWVYADPTAFQWGRSLPENGGFDIGDWISDGATKEQILGAIEPRRVISNEISEPIPKTSIRWPDLVADRHQLCVTKTDANGDSVLIPQLDLNFTISKILTGADGGGLVLDVKRMEGDRLITAEVYVKSDDLLTVADFIKALQKGVGPVCSTLKNNQLAGLIKNRQITYYGNGGRTYRLADRTGQQDGGTWVFEDCQLTVNGTPTTELESGWVFNHQLGEVEKIPSPKIKPQEPNALRNLVLASAKFFHPETLPIVLFTIGYAAATGQRAAVMETEQRFPQLSLFGDPGSGKTTAAKISASIFAMHNKPITRFSESVMYETVKSLGGVPLILDDPRTYALTDID